jgi:hypothetical protein
MDRWKTTALLAMGMLAGQLYATACSGVGAKLGTDTSVALAAGGAGAGRAVVELLFDAEGDYCGAKANQTGSNYYSSYTEWSDWALQADNDGDGAYDDRRFSSDCNCPAGFSRIGIPARNSDSIVCLED